MHILSYPCHLIVKVAGWILNVQYVQHIAHVHMALDSS